MKQAIEQASLAAKEAWPVLLGGLLLMAILNLVDINFLSQNVVSADSNFVENISKIVFWGVAAVIFVFLGMKITRKENEKIGLAAAVISITAFYLYFSLTSGNPKINLLNEAVASFFYALVVVGVFFLAQKIPRKHAYVFAGIVAGMIISFILPGLVPDYNVGVALIQLAGISLAFSSFFLLMEMESERPFLQLSLISFGIGAAFYFVIILLADAYFHPFQEGIPPWWLAKIAYDIISSGLVFAVAFISVKVFTEPEGRTKQVRAKSTTKPAKRKAKRK